VRIAAFIVSVVVSCVLTLGGTLLVVFAAPPRVDWTLLLATTSLVALVFGPVVLGSLTAYWDFRGDAARRRLLRRWIVGVVLSEVAGVAAIVAYAVINGSPWWLVVVHAGGGALLTAVALVVGPAVQRREAASGDATPTWVPITPHEIVRKVVRIAAVFTGVLVVGLVVVVVVFTTVDGLSGELASGLGLAVALAFFAGAITCVVTSLSFNRALREATDRDPALVQKVGKVVLRGKAVDLEPAERVAAARYAQVVAVTLPFQFAYLVMLYAGIAIQQVQGLSSGTNPFALPLLVVLVVVLVAFLPLTVLRIARARRYAREHAAEADPDPRTPTDAPAETPQEARADSDADTRS
jgi:hypothetical protein